MKKINAYFLNILSFSVAYFLSSYFFSNDELYSVTIYEEKKQENELILERRNKKNLNQIANNNLSKERESSPSRSAISSYMNLNLSGYRFYEQLSTLQEARDQIKEMDETQIINALDELEKNNHDNFSLRILLYKHWTELNPEAAILHIDDTLQGHYLEDLHHRCIHQWMKVDHIGVLEFFKKNERLKSDSYYWNFEPVFSKVYTENKSLAVDYLITVPNKANALKGIFKKLNNSDDFISLINLTSKVEDPSDNTKNMILSKFGKEYTDDSYEWFEEQGHDKDAFKALFPSWLEKQRERSLELLLKHSENLQDAYNHMANLSNDPKNLQWLTEQPNSKEKDNALVKVVDSYFHMMDAKALFLSINSIQNENLRKSTTEKVLEMADGRISPDDENKLKSIIKKY